MTPSVDVCHGPTLFDAAYQPLVEPFRPDQTAPARASASDNRSIVNQALVSHVAEIDHHSCDAGDEDSFFVCDLGLISRAFATWKRHLPRVHPFYAVKCNPNVEVLRLLLSLGANFDCASKTEIDTVLGLGIAPARIVYANPCKTNSFIRHAASAGVNMTTVDNPHELYKLKQHHPQCGILIRIVTDDEGALCRLSTKFGCSLDVAINQLLPLAHQLGLTVRGVAFHVGSGAKDFRSITRAIGDARTVFDKGIDLYGHPMNVLDIGGGFEPESFGESSHTVNAALDTFFPASYLDHHGIELVAEPGRFMVSNAFTLATHVIARRDLADDKIKAMIYINDGVYGNLNCILFDHQHPQAKVLKHGDTYHFQSTNQEGEVENDAEQGKHHFSIWGPTCDGLDCVSSDTVLSHDVEVGDWLYFSNVGAYTSTSTTSFNGFKGNAHVVYVSSAS
ncbi:ornithine decarboxylase [Suhomyces tanzawaensis NRRL Y-17324]|uniref:Ornithine decarboxylase n=1 Tax=Suhomyces tanzawaensis NRRL Y-17324 TaxID=984487 RepID=A0A1E4SML4_9ASCO|nr:ornithine decarboxylase [Suhomyces tanzawaensis NRRL Y-17324]ODV80769.1 ornithine decarboxylase [Suhomyces tanzawaensis NRRL Y-17324]